MYATQLVEADVVCRGATREGAERKRASQPPPRVALLAVVVVRAAALDVAVGPVAITEARTNVTVSVAHAVTVHRCWRPPVPHATAALCGDATLPQSPSSSPLLSRNPLSVTVCLCQAGPQGGGCGGPVHRLPPLTVSRRPRECPARRSAANAAFRHHHHRAVWQWRTSRRRAHSPRRRLPAVDMETRASRYLAATPSQAIEASH